MGLSVITGHTNYKIMIKSSLNETFIFKMVSPKLLSNNETMQIPSFKIVFFVILLVIDKIIF